MAHLDKTFPTGDCATCIVSPKLVECARNLNIEILTLSELVGLEGEPGHFKATVRRHPRFVIEDKCTGCSECTQVCPVDIPDEFNRCLGTRKGIAKLYARPPRTFSAFSRTAIRPANSSAGPRERPGLRPTHQEKGISQGGRTHPPAQPAFAICGRICTHPCESECTRGQADDAIAIRLLKRFASDMEMECSRAGKLTLPEEKTPAPDAKKVAIIGGVRRVSPPPTTWPMPVVRSRFTKPWLPRRHVALRHSRISPAKKVLDHEIEIIRR